MLAHGFLLKTTAAEERTLDGYLGSRPVLLIFFEISCPTCHLTLPLLQRLEGRFNVVGISQDDAESTVEFLEYFRITYPILLDPATEKYPVSAAYGIGSVPSMFLVQSDRRISWSLEGFSRAEMAGALGADLFRESDNVPEWKPGCGAKNSTIVLDV